MKTITRLLLVLIALLLMQAALWAATISSGETTYLSPFVGRYDLENDTTLHTLWGLRDGMFLSDYFAVEGWLARLVDDTKIPEGERGRDGWYFYRMDLLYYPWPLEGKRGYPFFAGGIGGIGLDLKRGFDISLVTDFGGGIEWPFPPFFRLRPTVRADARYLIRSLRGNISYATEVTFGLSFQWDHTREESDTISEETSNSIEEVAIEEFGSNQTQISVDQKRVLDALVKRLQKYPKSTLTLTGYTDSLGTTAFNLELSRRRALAVKAYLVSMGIQETRITSTGGGELESIEDILTSKRMGKNRRVIIRVFKNAQDY